MPAPADVVTEIEERFRPLLREAALAGWQVNVEATPANDERRIAADLALSDALADRDLFQVVERARESAADPQIRRQLDLVYASMLTRQVDADLRHAIIELEARVESAFVQHRGSVGGQELSDNELLEILKHSDDLPERRAAWEASKTIGAVVADDVRELARLRNQVARRLGRRDWFALSVEASEMREDKLFETLSACDWATSEPFARWKARTDEKLAERFGCSVGELRPWHYADPFFQEVPVVGGVDLDPYLSDQDVVALSERTFRGIGLETAAILARSDLYPRKGKSQHAFCSDIDRAGDVRVLANVVPGSYWADTMLHELGHAAYDLGYKHDLPYLLRDCHLTITEGIAMLMGGLVATGDWLRRVAGVDAAAVDVLEPKLQAARTAERLLFTRWVLVMTGFERYFYANPEADLDRYWWDLVQRYQLVTPPESQPPAAWAAKIHIACAPIYYHTYLYGHLVAAQLRAMLADEVGGLVEEPRAGQLLADRVFVHGESLRWDQLLQRATGRPLSVEPFASELVA